MKRTFKSARKNSQATNQQQVINLRSRGGDVIGFALGNKKAVNFLNSKERLEYKSRLKSTTKTA